MNPSLPGMRLLRNVAFAGAVSGPDDLTGIEGDRQEIVLALVSAGLLEADGLLLPTQAGLDALEDWYARDRALLDGVARAAIHEGFRPLDLRLKSLASHWQHADARDDWDARMAAVEGLVELHAGTVAWLDAEVSAVTRFDEYRTRLTGALERVLDGDTGYFVKVHLDSYHTVWFQMHEDLLRLLEREREVE